MAYSQLTLDDLCVQLGILLDDEKELFWTRNEKIYAVWEGLRVWGALTWYWRERGSFNIDPTAAYYDLSVQLPDLRPRTTTLQQLVVETQYMCAEAANGISGVGMSGQISVQSIINALIRARNKFVIDTHIPYSIHTITSPAPPDGMIVFPQASVYVHRAMWQDQWSGRWTNLWREDAWAIDKSNQQWTIDPSSPSSYSESEQAPLKLQLAPIPSASGAVEIVSVDSVAMDPTDAGSLFLVPDEWAHAIKYAALSDLYSSESQNTDPVRAQYAEMRYEQAVNFCKSARSVMRLLLNSVPLPLDSLAAIDAGSAYWRNQNQKPSIAGAMYDFVSFDCTPDTTYGLAVDVVRAAPLPQPGPNSFIQLGSEDIDNLFDYVSHILIFKCGGKEFTQTFPQYDSFMGAVAGRGAINKAKIKYLEPLFGQPEKEDAERPDKMEKARA